MFMHQYSKVKIKLCNRHIVAIKMKKNEIWRALSLSPEPLTWVDPVVGVLSSDPVGVRHRVMNPSCLCVSCPQLISSLLKYDHNP